MDVIFAYLLTALLARPLQSLRPLQRSLFLAPRRLSLKMQDEHGKTFDDDYWEQEKNDYRAPYLDIERYVEGPDGKWRLKPETAGGGFERSPLPQKKKLLTYRTAGPLHHLADPKLLPNSKDFWAIDNEFEVDAESVKEVRDDRNMEDTLRLLDTLGPYNDDFEGRSDSILFRTDGISDEIKAYTDYTGEFNVQDGKKNVGGVGIWEVDLPQRHGMEHIKWLEDRVEMGRTKGPHSHRWPKGENALHPRNIQYLEQFRRGMGGELFTLNSMIRDDEDAAEENRTWRRMDHWIPAIHTTDEEFKALDEIVKEEAGYYGPEHPAARAVEARYRYSGGHDFRQPQWKGQWARKAQCFGGSINMGQMGQIWINEWSHILEDHPALFESPEPSKNPMPKNRYEYFTIVDEVDHLRYRKDVSPVDRLIAARLWLVLVDQRWHFEYLVWKHYFSGEDVGLVAHDENHVEDPGWISGYPGMIEMSKSIGGFTLEDNMLIEDAYKLINKYKKPAKNNGWELLSKEDAKELCHFMAENNPNADWCTTKESGNNLDLFPPEHTHKPPFIR